MASGLVVAVVGVTGAVGQTTLKLLEERKFPVRELRAFASARSVGKTVTFKGESVRVEAVGPDSFRGGELAFFSAGSSQSKALAPGPRGVPQITPHAVRGHRGILACPNCTTIVTVMPLKPLHDAGRLRRVVATSYQSVSGAGVNGVEELRSQTLAWARGEAITPRYFQHQIAFNVIPHIDKFGDNGYTGEEMKLVNEVRKILELPDLPVSPTTVRVPVFTAHSVAVNAETEVRLGRERAREVLAGFPGLKLWDEPADNRYPMPVLVEGQDDCYVGRIREDLSMPNALNFWVVGDQLRKGAALNGIAIAELLIRCSPDGRARARRPSHARLRGHGSPRLAGPAGARHRPGTRDGRGRAGAGRARQGDRSEPHRRGGACAPAGGQPLHGVRHGSGRPAAGAQRIAAAGGARGRRERGARGVRRPARGPRQAVRLPDRSRRPGRSVPAALRLARPRS